MQGQHCHLLTEIQTAVRAVSHLTQRQGGTSSRGLGEVSRPNKGCVHWGRQTWRGPVSSPGRVLEATAKNPECTEHFHRLEMMLLSHNNVFFALSVATLYIEQNKKC